MSSRITSWISKLNSLKTGNPSTGNFFEVQLDGTPRVHNGSWSQPKDLLPITEEVEYTVAADGDPAGVMDFDSLQDAFDWLQFKTSSGAFYVTFYLEDGDHIIDYETEKNAFTNLNIYLYSTSGDASKCFITLKHDTETADGWYYMLVFNGASECWISDITIDPYKNGFIGNQHMTVLLCHGAASTGLFHSILDGGNIGIMMDNISNFFWYASVIDGMTAQGIATLNSSTVALTGGEINNCGTGLEATEQGRMYYDGTTFSGNTVDTASPINEVRETGSYIADGTGPLVPIFSSGTTGERPSGTVVTGFNYFDTTLGIPIWFDGTNWVNHAGTTV